MNEKAELLFTDIWVRTNSRFSDVYSFQHYTTETLPHVKKITASEYNNFVKSLANDEGNDKFFKDKQGFFDVAGGIDSLSAQLTQRQLESYQKAIDSSLIVLAHSALDAAAFDYFLVIEIIAPIEDLERYVNKKQISLEDLKGADYSELMRQKIHRFIVELDRRSLLEKIDKLFEICQPPPNFSPIHNHVFNRNKIETLDTLRHEIVHGNGLDAPLPTCLENIKYMRDTANFLMALVNKKYNIKMNPTLWGESQKNKSNKPEL
jgi:hypothetical protein